MELYDLLEEYGKTHDKGLEEKIKNVLSPYKDGAIGIAQINPVIGDLKYNAKKIVEYINFAQNIGLDLVIFPELALMGYPIEDVIDRHPIIVEENIKWLKEIAKITTKTTALVGFVEPNNKSGKEYFNSVAVLEGGKIKEIVRKSLLPTYCEFNDCRYIEPSHTAGSHSGETLGCFDNSISEDSAKSSLINGKKYAITICEDCWNDREFFKNNNLYRSNPLDELKKDNPDVFINCSASPSRNKKEQLKRNMFSFLAKKYETPFVYVNQVGAVDNISFDGASRVYDKNGELIARLKAFEEQFLIVNIDKKLGKIYEMFNDEPNSSKTFSLNYEDDLERTYRTIIQGIRDYFGKNGFKRAVLGLSGGLDSTVSAVLLADALSSENVYGISMPSTLTSQTSKSDAKQLAENLGINYTEIPVKNVVSTVDGELQPLFKEIEGNWNCRYKQSFTMDNIQARTRAVFLWSVSNEFEACIPIATSDKSELYMGYATINGDMSGGFAPIADVTKTKLFALARWLNKNREVKNAIPESVILKRPSAELAINPKTGKALLAEEALMPYEFLDEIIWRVENKKENYYDMLDSEFIYEKEHSISKEQKAEWLDKFYSRMSKALYKWSIVPPSVIVDSYSINKNEYRQPITTSRINYKRSNESEIEGMVKSFN